MTDFDEIHGKDLPSLHWALKFPNIRDGRGARDRAAHELLHFLALHADFKTGEAAYPSVQSMADAIGADRPFTRRKLDFLEELGLIRRMDVEDIAELLEERKVKSVPTSWHEMAEGTQENYERRFDSETGVTPWALAIDDEDLWNRLANADAERKRTTEAKTRTRHRRHNHKRYGTPAPEEACDTESPVAEGDVATGSSPSHDGENPVARRPDLRRATDVSPSHDGPNPVVRRRVGPQPPIDPPVTAQVIARERPEDRSASAAQDAASVPATTSNPLATVLHPEFGKEALTERMAALDDEIDRIRENLGHEGRSAR